MQTLANISELIGGRTNSQIVFFIGLAVVFLAAQTTVRILGISTDGGLWRIECPEGTPAG